MTLRPRILCFLLFSVPALAAARTYPDPSAAAEALASAARTQQVEAVVKVLGEGSRSFLISGDPVADRTALRRFVELYDRAHSLSEAEDHRHFLLIGEDPWSFPVPIVKGKTGWVFDPKAGAAEILARRVGQNELDAIQVCLGFVGAQRDYFARNPEGAAVPHYADHLLSSPGKRDGLYWASPPGEAESPMGPAVSGAMGQGYELKRGKSAAYRGYHYRILTAQGPNARGGALDYRENGRLTRGFALLAYPAAYGKSGVMSFLVNQDGVVLEKDLGPKTAKLAAAISAFDPDEGWRPAQPFQNASAAPR